MGLILAYHCRTPAGILVSQIGGPGSEPGRVPDSSFLPMQAVGGNRWDNVTMSCSSPGGPELSPWLLALA